MICRKSLESRPGPIASSRVSSKSRYQLRRWQSDGEENAHGLTLQSKKALTWDSGKGENNSTAIAGMTGLHRACHTICGSAWEQEVQRLERSSQTHEKPKTVSDVDEVYGGLFFYNKTHQRYVGGMLSQCFWRRVS